MTNYLLTLYENNIYSLLSVFTQYTIFLVLGVFLQIIAFFPAHIIEKENDKIQKKSFSFMLNNVSMRYSLLFCGMFFVNIVALFESDYILFVGQSLFFALLYPKRKKNNH